MRYIITWPCMRSVYGGCIAMALINPYYTYLYHIIYNIYYHLALSTL